MYYVMKSFVLGGGYNNSSGANPPAPPLFAHMRYSSIVSKYLLQMWQRT